MKHTNTVILATIAVLWALPVLALDLQTARGQGLVGEKTDGYVAAVKSTADTEALVDEVNAKRKVEYARISKENGQPVDVVGKVAAEQVISNLPKGAMYQDASGNWKSR
jgi:uncharacterized protein YdbL (DUF1318 family)